MTGPIALLGSGEFEPWAADGDRLLLTLATGDGSVAILPLASAPEGETYADWAHKGLTHFDDIGVPARVIEVKERGDAFKEDLLGELDRVSVVYLSGGNPAFLADAVVGTPLGDALLGAVDRGAGLAGCSAGACLIGEASPESVTDRIDEEAWMAGLRLLPGVWVVPHWDALGEETRRYFVSRIPASGIVLGIDEATMLIGGQGGWVVFGAGSVFIRSPDGEGRWGAADAIPIDLPVSGGA
jgi:cyanophycinase